MVFLSFQHEKQKIQVEAIDTLKSFAVLTPVCVDIWSLGKTPVLISVINYPNVNFNCCMQETFRQNYYETTVEALKVIVFDEHSLPGPLISAKCLECMVYLVRKVGPDNFKEQEADLVSTSANSVLNWLKLYRMCYWNQC